MMQVPSCGKTGVGGQRSVVGGIKIRSDAASGKKRGSLARGSDARGTSGEVVLSLALRED